MIKYKLNKPDLIRLSNMLQAIEVAPKSNMDLIICGLADKFIEQIRRKVQNDAQRHTLSYKNYEALAFAKYIELALAQESDFKNAIPLYNLLQGLQRSTIECITNSE